VAVHRRHRDGPRIYEVLHEFGRIDQDALAQRFAARYKAQPWRGYGGGAHRLLEQVGNGIPWRAAAESVFPGGSFGNGSAMRIAPLAAYFAEDDYAVIADQARLSAEVTHLHPRASPGRSLRPLPGRARGGTAPAARRKPPAASCSRWRWRTPRRASSAPASNAPAASPST
jgi:hypothetical protein